VSRKPPAVAVAVGTRGSPLARRQTALLVDLLHMAWPGLVCEERLVVTTGDRTQRSGEPLPEIGGKGLFTAELEQGLRDGDLDLAVHSLKDLPTEETDGIVLGAVCLRDDVRDCLVSRDGLSLTELPEGAMLGTSSLRRAAQLHVLRPGLELASIRGNVDTRIRKVREEEYDATVLAAAGVRRLGLEAEVAEWIPAERLLPAPGQGALAVQCREGDGRILELLGAIDDAAARATTTAERTFLAALGGGCAAPVAAHATLLDERGGEKPPSVKLTLGGLLVSLEGLVASPDGSHTVRVTGQGEPQEVGARLAREALAGGADRILADVRG
jgi:hydroxymethylbilane synthase